MARPKIVWLASFPKSGNTWFRVLLANLTAGDNGPADINNLDLPGGIASDRREFEETIMIDTDLLSHDDIDSLRPRVYESIARTILGRRWIKVHDAYTLTTTGDPIFGHDTACAAVYLVRDPRDVAVSFALSVSRTGLSPQLPQKLLSWSGHVTSWLDQKDILVHLVRYEDLVAAPAEFFSSAFDFVGQVATRSDVERAVRHSDFAELQRQERANGFRECMSRAEPFFHTGKVGGWLESLTAEQAQAIVRCHGVVMARLGYGLLSAAA